MSNLLIILAIGLLIGAMAGAGFATVTYLTRHHLSRSTYYYRMQVAAWMMSYGGFGATFCLVLS